MKLESWNFWWLAKIAQKPPRVWRASFLSLTLQVTPYVVCGTLQRQRIKHVPTEPAFFKILLIYIHCDICNAAYACWLLFKKSIFPSRKTITVRLAFRSMNKLVIVFQLFRVFKKSATKFDWHWRMSVSLLNFEQKSVPKESHNEAPPPPPPHEILGNHHQRPWEMFLFWLCGKLVVEWLFNDRQMTHRLW